MSGEVALDKMIATARYVAGGGFARDGMQAAARTVEGAVRGTAAAGTSPEGEPWAATKKGGRAMAHAAAAVSVVVVGTVLLLKLAGAEVFHHFGVRGAPARPVIPRGSMPDRLGNAVRLGFVEVWKTKVRK